MTCVVVGAPMYERRGGEATLVCTIDVEGQKHEIFYRASQGPLATGADPFVPLALFPAMKLGAELHIEGNVSARLLRHLEQIQSVICTWWPSFRKVPVRAMNVTPTQPMPPQVTTACFFSGGIDSSYAVLKRRAELTHLIFVRGFDMHPSNHALWNVVAPPIRNVARELGKSLIEVQTNARSLFDLFAGWEAHCNGAALAGVALALAPQVQTVYIAGAFPYDALPSDGNHPLLNALWSNGTVEIAYDADRADRWDKLQSLVVSRTALRWLRVCYENPGDAYNCGRCRKCLEVRCYLKAADVLQDCPTFDQTIDLDAVAHMPIETRSILTIRRSLLAAVERLGTQSDFTRAIRASILSSALAHEHAQERLPGLARRQAEIEAQVQHSEARVAKLAARLRTMQTSKSWRLTAPLRSIASAAPRLGRWRNGE